MRYLKIISLFLLLSSCVSATDSTAPQIFDGKPNGTLEEGTKTVTISVKTNEDANCKYSVTTTRVEYELMPFSFNKTEGKEHSSILSNLADGQSYNIYVRCKDIAGNVNNADYPISFSVAIASGGGKFSKLLFIGNSLTGHSGGVQNHLQKMLEEGGYTVEVAGEIHGGEAFSRTGENYPGHVNRPEVTARIKSNNWDAVILQSYGTTETEEQFIKSGNILIDRVEANGSKAVLFLVWGRRNHPEQDAIHKQRYDRLGKERNVDVVPIAIGIRAAHNAGLDVYGDAEHLSLKGAYLAAAMYYAFFTHKSPVGLKFDGFVGSGYFGRLSAKEALELQKQAWKTMSEQGVFWDNK